MAQIMTPVKWSSKLEMTGDAEGQVVLTASISGGWHMYSSDVDPDVGPQRLESPCHPRLLISSMTKCSGLTSHGGHRV